MLCGCAIVPMSDPSILTRVTLHTYSSFRDCGLDHQLNANIKISPGTCFPNKADISGYAIFLHCDRTHVHRSRVACWFAFRITEFTVPEYPLDHRISPSSLKVTWDNASRLPMLIEVSYVR